MDNLDDILKKLLSAIPEVEAAMIVSTEGFPIVSALPQDINETRMAAMNAALLSLAERAVIEMEKGDFEQMYFGGSKGHLIVSQTGPNAVFTVSTPKNVRLGLIFTELERNFEDFDKPPSPPGEIGVDGKLKPENIPDKKKLEDIGLTIASALPKGIDETMMATITAALFSLAKRAVIEMEKGEFEHMYIRGSEGYLLILPAGPNTLLAVSTTKNIRLGLIFMDCKKTAEKIAKLI